MTNNQVTQAQLLHFITKIGFVLDDITLYLDTHPEDEKALDYFNHYSEIKEKALKEYEKLYGPLTDDAGEEKQHFRWATQPWPWEGGRR